MVADRVRSVVPEEALCAVKRLPARVFQSVAVFSDYRRLLEPKVPMFDELVVTVPKLASLPLNVPLSVWMSNFVSPTKFWLRLVDGKNPYIRRFVRGCETHLYGCSFCESRWTAPSLNLTLPESSLVRKK